MDMVRVRIRSRMQVRVSKKIMVRGKIRLMVKFGVSFSHQSKVLGQGQSHGNSEGQRQHKGLGHCGGPDQAYGEG